MRGLAKLLPAGDLRGRDFLDIGCGSGLSMLAALRLGAKSVTGIDIDPDSVEAARGMSWSHDVHDWLGGYPYESVTPQQVSAVLGDLGFDEVRSFEKPATIQGMFGSHCAEFVAVRRA